MKFLRDLIRKIITTEDYCKKINKKIASAIDSLETKNFYISILDDSKSVEIQIVSKESGKSIGVVEARKSSAEGLGRPCLNSYKVGWAEVDFQFQGFGALLYDVLIEYSGKNGIAADRLMVSKDAIRMWRWFKSNPQLYEAFPLDQVPPNNFTSSRNDDCQALSWREYPAFDGNIYAKGIDDMIHKDRKKAQEIFQSHELNNKFVKIDSSKPTINCLKRRGLLIRI